MVGVGREEGGGGGGVRVLTAEGRGQGGGEGERGLDGVGGEWGRAVERLGFLDLQLLYMGGCSRGLLGIDCFHGLADGGLGGWDCICW